MTWELQQPRPEPENLLLIAAREPLPGFTKTRLGTEIGMERAAHLYRAFLGDLAHRFAPANNPGVNYRFGWAFTPAAGAFRSEMVSICPAAAGDETLFVPQHGANWTEGQTHLLRWGAEQGYRRTVLTASDSPHLSRRQIADAFALLEGHDVALGRVHDGGYYLIGLRGFHDVFSGVPMSTGDAADGLIDRARGLGLTTGEVSATFDVDTAADLPLLRAEIERNPGAAPVTWQALHDLGLMASLHPAGGPDQPGGGAP